MSNWMFGAVCLGVGLVGLAIIIWGCVVAEVWKLTLGTGSS